MSADVYKLWFARRRRRFLVRRLGERAYKRMERLYRLPKGRRSGYSNVTWRDYWHGDALVREQRRNNTECVQ